MIRSAHLMLEEENVILTLISIDVISTLDSLGFFPGNKHHEYKRKERGDLFLPLKLIIIVNVLSWSPVYFRCVYRSISCTSADVCFERRLHENSLSMTVYDVIMKCILVHQDNMRERNTRLHPNKISTSINITHRGKSLSSLNVNLLV